MGDFILYHALVNNFPFIEPDSKIEINSSTGDVVFGGSTFRTLRLSKNNYDQGWLERQELSLKDYEMTQVESDLDELTDSTYTLFANFLVITIFLNDCDTVNLLDVGCGIREGLPPYVDDVSKMINYFGLDPLEINFERDYPFFCGDLANLAEIKSLHNSFDVIVFATSLDHINDLDEAVKAVNLLAAPGGLLVSWSGIHNPEITSEHNGVLVFNELMKSDPVSAILKWFGYFILRFPRLIFRSFMTRRKIKRGIPLDPAHEHYFTEESLRETMGFFGEVVSSVRVPGSNSVFDRVLIGKKVSRN
ncbi:MAG: methyltransferase domain-containing protein [Nitrospinota bacterium]|nr:methyltransferase domain-containing protein [Nitrospinota bacterium]